MRDYMVTLGTIMMMIAFSNILLPDGSIKKFASLATGFMLICAVVSPLPSLVKEMSLPESFEIKEEDIEKTQAQYRARVLKEHKENLENKISEKLKHGSRVSVEVSSQGEILSVSIILKGDESSAVAYIVQELNVERERIKLKYENN